MRDGCFGSLSVCCVAAPDRGDYTMFFDGIGAALSLFLDVFCFVLVNDQVCGVGHFWSHGHGSSLFRVGSPIPSPHTKQTSMQISGRKIQYTVYSSYVSSVVSGKTWQIRELQFWMQYCCRSRGTYTRFFTLAIRPCRLLG
jgi:hypothetical protein